MLYQKIFLFGLDKSGKTALSQALRTGHCDEIITPTTAFDIKAFFLQYFSDSVEFRIWDAPGQTSYRSNWGEGYSASNLMIFVLDTADNGRFAEAKQVLENVLKDPVTNSVPLIFLFHKMDLLAAKKFHNEALQQFKDTMTIGGRKCYQLKTSIKQPKSLENLKDTIAKIVEDSRKDK